MNNIISVILSGDERQLKAALVSGARDVKKFDASVAESDAALAKYGSRGMANVAKFGGGLQSFGSKWTKSVTAPVLAFGAIAIGAATKYNEATHIIEQRTDATGSSLRGLRADFDAVAKTSGADLSHIAEVVANLHVALGLTGKPLQDLVRQFLTLERISGQGAPTIDQVSKAMVAWKVSGEDVSKMLDHVYVASTKTNVPVSTLLDDITRAAPTLRHFGFTMDQAVGFVASLGKAGIQTSRVIFSMNTYLSKAATNGQGAAKTFEKLVTQTEKLYKSGHKAEALKLLNDAGFKGRALSQIATAIEDGRLNTEALVRAMQAGEGAIADVGKATIPLSVRLNMLKNQTILALAPIGNDLLPVATSAAHQLVTVITFLGQAFDHLPKGVRIAGLDFLLGAAVIGPLTYLAGGFIRLGAGIVGASQVLATAAPAMYSQFLLIASGADITAASLATLAPVLFAIAASVGAYYGVTKLLNSQVNAAAKGKDIKGTADALEDLGKRGTVSTKLIDDWGPHFKRLGTYIKTLNESGIRKFGRELDSWVPPTKVAQAGITNLNKSLVDLVTSGKGEVARKAYGKISNELIKQGISSQQVARRFGLYWDAVDKVREKQNAASADRVKNEHDVAQAVAATGGSAKIARSDLQKYNDKISSDLTGNAKKAYTAAHLTFAAVEADAKELGISFDQALTVNPKTLVADVKKLDTFVAQVRQKWTSFFDPVQATGAAATGSEIKAATKQVTDAQAAVDKARATDAKNAQKAAAAKDKASRASSLQAQRDANAIATAEASLAKARAAKTPNQDSIAAAERRLQMAKDTAAAHQSDSTASADLATNTSTLTDAQSRLAEAQQNLKDLTSTGPDQAQKVKDFYQTQAFLAGQFINDIKTLYKDKYPTSLIAQIIADGPQQGGKLAHTLVQNNSDDLVQIVTDTQAAFDKLTAIALDQARLQAIATDPKYGSQKKVRELAAANAISSATEAGTKPLTPDELKIYTGLTPEAAQKIAGDFGIELKIKPPPVDLNTDPAVKKNDAMTKIMQAWAASHWNGNVDLDTTPAMLKLMAISAALTSLGTIPGLGGIAAVIPGLTAPPRATGGQVRAGHPYWVGEHHAELFVPGGHGRIIANPRGVHPVAGPQTMSNGAGGTIHVTNQFTISANTDRQLVAMVHREVVPLIHKHTVDAIGKDYRGFVKIIKQNEGSNPR